MLVSSRRLCSNLSNLCYVNHFLCLRVNGTSKSRFCSYGRNEETTPSSLFSSASASSVSLNASPSLSPSSSESSCTSQVTKTYDASAPKSVPCFSRFPPSHIWKILADSSREFSGPALAAAFFQLSKKKDLSFSDPQVPLLCKRIAENTSQLRASDISNVLLAAHRFQIADIGFWSVLCKQASEFLDEFNEHSISNMFYALSGAHDRADLVLLNKLMERVISLPSTDFTPQGIAMILGALVKLEIYQEAFITKLCTAGTKDANQFNAHAIAATLRSLSKITRDVNIGNKVEGIYKSFVVALLACAQREMRNFTPQGLAGVLSAFDEKYASCFNDEILLGLMKECGNKVEQFNGQDIANVLSAFVRLETDNKLLLAQREVLVDQLRARTLSHVSSLPVQALVPVLSAFAKLGLTDRFLVVKLCARARKHLSEFTSQGVANTLNALSKFKQNDALDASAVNTKSFVQGLCVLGATKSFTPFGIAACLNGLAKLDLYDEPFVTKLREQALDKAKEFHAHEIANTIHALSKMDVFDKELISILSDQGLGKLDDFNAQAIANTLFALSKFGVRHSLISRLRAIAQERVETFNAQNIADTLRALAVMEVRDSALIGRLYARAKLLRNSFSEYDRNATQKSLADLNVALNPFKESSFEASRCGHRMPAKNALSEKQASRLKSFSVNYRRKVA